MASVPIRSVQAELAAANEAVASAAAPKNVNLQIQLGRFCMFFSYDVLSTTTWFFVFRKARRLLAFASPKTTGWRSSRRAGGLGPPRRRALDEVSLSAEPEDYREHLS